MSQRPTDKPLSDASPEEDSSITTSITHMNLDTPLETIYSRFIAHHTPFGFQTRNDRDVTFHPMPYKPDAGDTYLLKEPWRVMLELYVEDQRMVVGLDLYGDLILGRGQSRPGHIVLNLDEYNAQSLGVSREHTMIRPTKSQLYVIDQGSTNGTVVNGAPSGRGVATPLKHEDLLRLGNLVLMVYILAKPSTAR